MAGLAIEFHDHSVLAVEDVPPDAATSLHGVSLPFGGRQAMGSLDVSQVAIFQRRVHAIGDILERLKNLRPPARPPAHLHSLPEQDGKGEAALAGPG